MSRLLAWIPDDLAARRRTAAAAVAVVFTAIVVVTAVVEGLNSPSTPRSNIRYRDGRYAVVAIAPGDILDRAGVRPGDEIVGLNGRAFPGTFDFWDRLGAVEIGDRVTFDILREGEPFELGAETWRLARPVDAARVLLPVVVLMILGIGVFVVRPTLEATFLLLLYCLAAAINDVVQIAPVVGSQWPQRLLTFAYTICSLPNPAILLHLFLVFPHRGRFQRLAWPALWIAYAIQIGLALDYLIPSLIPASAAVLSSPSLTRPLVTLYSASVTGCYLISFASLVATIVGHVDFRTRNQAKVLATGLALLLALQITAVELPLRLSQRTLLDPYTLCLFDLVVPIFVAIAVVRQRLFGIDILIRHGLVYGAASTIVGATFVISLGAIGWVADQLRFSAPTVIIAVAAALAAILFHPARGYAQELVDRWVYRRRYSYRQLLTATSRRLASFVELPAALEYLGRQIDIALEPEWIAVALVDSTGGLSRFFDTRDKVDANLPAMTAERISMASKGRTEPFAPDDQDLLPNRTTALVVPILRGDEVLGAGLLGPRRGRIPYLPEDLDFLATVANLTSTVAANARLLEERSMRERLALLGSASSRLIHELKNPLSAMHSTLAVLRRRMVDDPTGEELTDIVANEIGHLNDRVLNVLAFVRPQAQGTNETDVGELLARLVPVVEAEFSTVGVDLSLRVSENGATVRGDPERLRQVFLNLLINAREAMPAGGAIDVEVTMEGRIEAKPAAVVITVSDTGTGFAAEDLERVFDAFFTTKTLGTGLGLANVCQIIEEHSGTVVARNGDRGGGEVVVRLPAFQIATNSIGETPPGKDES